MKDKITQNKKYALFLCSIPGIGVRTRERLLKHFGDAKGIYEGSADELGRVLSDERLKKLLEARRVWKPDEKYDELIRKGINFVTIEEENYPERLRNIADAPYGVFYIGRLPKEDRLSVAVIGARDCSEYGRYVAAELGRRLGSAGIQVISGMARGIDGISQIAALNAGGSSYAVLGSGADVCYPAQNSHIYDRLMEGGGIISTYPPGTAAMPGNFPPRNRIVSGLSEAIVVIEARIKSGTLITVDMALEQGRDVYAVPGRVTDRLSDGCNSLIRQGAEVFISPEKFIDEILERHHMKACNADRKAADAGCGSEKSSGLTMQNGLAEVAGELDFTPRDADEICSRLKNKKTVAEVSAALMQLTLMDIAQQISPGHFVLRKICN